MNVSSQETSGVELNEQLTSSIIDLPRTAEHCLENGKGNNNGCKQKNITFGANEDKVSDQGVNLQKEVVEGSSSAPSMEVDVECKTDVTEGMDRGSHTPEKSPAIVGHSTKGTDKKASPTGSNDMMETCNVVKAEKDVEADVSENLIGKWSLPRKLSM
ncbi:hypothetical protein J1N35_042506 [Gossypium stocksii]|uniref:Uncharacterized protein n=1 Tax=Gossypium stocksii TaxID=47602 RepID=A0A9D3U5N1_9ROSI|nr:hypothetical protein J1N35_042506 [Gossypium stocksii]